MTNIKCDMRLILRKLGDEGQDGDITDDDDNDDGDDDYDNDDHGNNDDGDDNDSDDDDDDEELTSDYWRHSTLFSSKIK